ncbi:LOW QUALITY PROTEIN: hypothetical protein Cgig2_016245 [Carnegiea gigantea]|uniref:Uncharacterized protein n=1 Tax=Carnegiea gigantea TaxID=171969 RepID=A0A9Q1JR87_9CARY|nr:LOW QUALITY PROTEIN: hypothetical protein Cgig2_016245 [Carnegiea gigantea]
MQNLSKPSVQQVHISEVEISSDTSDDKESSAKEVKSNDESSDRSSEKPREEKKPSDKSLTNSSTKKDRKKNKQLRAGGSDGPITATFKYEKGGNEKKMSQKVFIMRMSIHSFSSMVAQLNEADTEAVRSMGFASFLKVDLKQLLRKFSKWVVDSFHPYSASFVLPDGQRFMVTTFDAYVTLDVLERKSSSATGLQRMKNMIGCMLPGSRNGKLSTLPKLTRMPEFILAKKYGGKSFKGNFIIYLVNYFFSGSKNCYCGKSILKYVKDVNQIAFLDWCKFVVQKLIIIMRHYKESKSTKGVHFDSLLLFLMVSSTIEQPSPFIKLVNNMTKHSDHLKKQCQNMLLINN